MKSTRHITTSILAALGTSLVFASAHAQSTAPATTDATPSTSTATPADPSNAKQYRGKGSGMEHGKGSDKEHGKGQGKHHGMKGQGSEMSKLMTPEERTQMRNKMQAAKTPEERQALRTSMRTEMQKRAKEQGITLPEGKGGQKHRHGAHSG